MKENYEFIFYFGGTSITKGGGFEPLSARTDIRPLYKEKYGIDLPSQEECSYASIIAKNLKATKFINDAKSGSGTKRIIRKATEYITKNYLTQPHSAHLFHFEFQPGIRDDIYFSKENHHGICNASWNKEKKKYQFSLVKEWFTEDKENRRLDKVYGDGYQTWIDNHFDEVIYHKEESRMIMNFIGWLDSMGMQNEYTFSMGSFDDCVWFNKDVHQFQDMETHPRCVNRYFNYTHPWGHAHDMGWLILDEIDFGDNHLGYWGAKKFANKMTSIIGETTHVGPAIGKYRNGDMEVIEFCSPHTDDSDWMPDLQVSIPHLKDLAFKRVPPDNCKLLDISYKLFHQGSDFNDYKHYYEEMYPIVKKNGGKVMVVLRQESWVGETEKLLKDVVIKEWGFKEEDLIILDCNIKRTELDYLIKTYQADPVMTPDDTQPLSSYFKNAWTPNDNPRGYSISCFVNKPNALRMHTLNELLSFGNSHQNLITARNIKEKDLVEYNEVTLPNIRDEFNSEEVLTHGLDNIEEIKKVIGKSLEDYIKPKDEERHNATLDTGGISYESVIEAYRESYFNIGMETYTINDKRHTFNDYMGILEHISEKTLLPLFCGTMVYMIFPGKNYKIMEDKWGLNFKYLKEEFNINYRENNVLEALKSIRKISEKTKGWDISNWQDLWKKYEKVTYDNYKVLENALYTDETQFKLLKILNHHVKYKDRPRHRQNFKGWNNSKNMGLFGTTWNSTDKTNI